MNYQAILEKIDQFFASENSDQLIQSFEKLGYEFEDIKSTGIERGQLHHYPNDSSWRYITKNKKGVANSCSFFFSFESTFA